jgi:hypothetical protein
MGLSLLISVSRRQLVVSKVESLEQISGVGKAISLDLAYLFWKILQKSCQKLL